MFVYFGKGPPPEGLFAGSCWGGLFLWILRWAEAGVSWCFYFVRFLEFIYHLGVCQVVCDFYLLDLLGPFYYIASFVSRRVLFVASHADWFIFSITVFECVGSPATRTHLCLAWHAFAVCPIPGVPENAERWIFSTLRAESVYLYIIRWSIFRRREWCLDHSIWLSNFDSIPFLEIRSFSNFAGFLRRISGELWRDKPSIRCFCGSPLIRGNKRNTEQWASTGRRMDCLSRQNSSLIRPKNPAKFENDRISWNDHRIKITQPNLKI